jgi:hypothetical protein
VTGGVGLGDDRNALKLVSQDVHDYGSYADAGPDGRLNCRLACDLAVAKAARVLLDTENWAYA